MAWRLLCVGSENTYTWSLTSRAASFPKAQTSFWVVRSESTYLHVKASPAVDLHFRSHERVFFAVCSKTYLHLGFTFSLLDNSTKVILDGFETKHVTG